MNADMKIDRATIYHPNARGTGSAVRLALYPAHERTAAGFIRLELAKQKTAVSVTSETPAFDWGNAIVAKLCVSDLAQMLMVFRGHQESIADGKGLFHRTATANAVIKFSHVIEPRPGYLFSVSSKPFDGELKDAYIMLRMEEAIWLSTAIEASMGVLVFGVPSAV